MADNDEIGFGGMPDPSTSSGGSGRSATKEYKAFDDDVVSFIIKALKAEGPGYAWSLKSSDAVEVTDRIREAHGLPDDVDYLSVEEFAPFEIEADGIGTAVTVTRDMLENSVEAGYVSEEEIEDMEFDDNGKVKWAFDGVKSSPQSDLAMCLNGFHSDDIVEAFGSGAKIRVMAGKMGHPDINAAHERYTNVRFYVSDSAQASLSRERARMTVGEIDRAEFEQWAEEHGFEDKV